MTSPPSVIAQIRRGLGFALVGIGILVVAGGLVVFVGAFVVTLLLAMLDDSGRSRPMLLWDPLIGSGVGALLIVLGALLMRRHGRDPGDGVSALDLAGAPGPPGTPVGGIIVGSIVAAVALAFLVLALLFLR